MSEQRSQRHIARRTFIALAAASASVPRAVPAQEPGRLYRLGDVHLSLRHTAWNDALFEGAKPDGFVVGQNLIVDDAGFGLELGQVADHAAVVVNAQVDLITAAGDPAVRAVHKATRSIPVLAIAEDMVGSGFVASLAEPKGNITGVSILSSDLNGKRQEILLEAIPGITRMAMLADTASISPQQLQALQDAARARGVAPVVCAVSKADEIIAAVDAAKNSGAMALNVLASALLFARRQEILSRIMELRLPAMFQWPDTAQEGSLIAYGPSIVAIYREIMSRQLVKLLRGANPADMPVEQPSKFSLAVNLKTAKAIGVEIPQSILLRADEVIE